MNTQLIPVFSGELSGVSVQLISARLLHTFLESAQQFADWIKNRIEDYGFIENQDFLLHKNMKQTGRGGHNKIDYHLTLDMAKELGMIERSDKGREIRRYFLDMERQAQGQHIGVQSQLPKQKYKPERRYSYPRNLLEQPYFTTERYPAGLNIAQLGNTKHYVSPLLALLNEMQIDGHDVGAPWDEAVAMREAIQLMNQTCNDMIDLATKARLTAASTAGRLL